MSTSEDERQAMLEKIRQDMAESRKRLAEMREKKARGNSICQPVSPVAQTPSTPNTDSATNKFSQATSLVDKLKAERELKKQASITNQSQPSNSDTDKQNEDKPLPVQGIQLYRIIH